MSSLIHKALLCITSKPLVSVKICSSHGGIMMMMMMMVAASLIVYEHSYSAVIELNTVL